jgi:hypothetical protein
MEGVNEPTKIHRSGKSHSVFYLSDLNPARISADPLPWHIAIAEPSYSPSTITDKGNKNLPK